MIREQLPKATIITFWHIPWPNFERLGICPWSEELLDGLLGSSILGFHTQFHCNNFFDSVDRYLEARIDREFDAVVYGGMRTLVRPYPISIDWPNRWAQGTAPAESAAPRSSRSCTFATTRRLASASIAWTTPRASKSACWRWSVCSRPTPSYRGVFTFIQAAAPSRSTIPEYQAIGGPRGRHRRAGEQAVRRGLVPAHHPAAAASRAAGRVPPLQGGGPLLREQPARRHEPGGQGVRRGARRRARRAGPQLVHRRVARAGRVAHRQSLRPRRGGRGAWRRRW